MTRKPIIPPLDLCSTCYVVLITVEVFEGLSELTRLAELTCKLRLYMCLSYHIHISYPCFTLSSVRPSAHPSVRPPVRPPIRPSAHPSARPSAHPSVRPYPRFTLTPMNVCERRNIFIAGFASLLFSIYVILNSDCRL